MRRSRTAILCILLGFLPIAQVMAAGSIELTVRAAAEEVEGSVTITNLSGGTGAEGPLVHSRFQVELPAGRYQISVKATQPPGQREVPAFDLASGEARAFYLRMNGQ